RDREVCPQGVAVEVGDVEVVPGRFLPQAPEGRPGVVPGFQQPTVLGLTRDPLRCGDDADCTAVFLAHGPSAGKRCGNVTSMSRVPTHRSYRVSGILLG